MIGFKIFLTGLVVMVFAAIIRKTIDPNTGTYTDTVIELVGYGALIAMFSGALVMVWSL